MKKTLGLLVCLFFSVAGAMAQTDGVFPLRYDLGRAQNNKDESNLRLAEDALILPFFDDFAGYLGNPNSLKWQNGGGTLVNNTYAVAPPTYNVATFDGLNDKGVPYDKSKPSARGTADNLTSLPINLSGLSVKDSVYLSFYWQAGGLGSQPDPLVGDKIELYFKDSLNKWNLIWSMEDEDTPFNQVFLALTNPKYFYSGFQFKFQSFGYIAGSFSAWNLDYIYLDKNRSIAKKGFEDIAITAGPTKILKNYRSMPYKQFYPFLDAEVNKQQSINAFNFSNGPGFFVLNNNAENLNYVIDDYSGDTLEVFSISGVANPKESIVITRDPDYSKFKDLNRPLKLKTQYKPFGTDSVLFKANNNIVDSTIIASEYAYDDNTAEAVFSVFGIKSTMAVKYSLNVPDSIAGIKINFQQYETNLDGTKLELFVWKSIEVGGGTTKEVIVHSKEVQLEYPGFNNFVYYKFDKPVALEGDFYVGFRQFVKDFVFVGYDLNTDSRAKTLVKKDEVWYNFDMEKPAGSLMIRPVFGGSDYITVGTFEKQLADNIQDWSVFPNPSTGTFYINGNIEVATVYDLSGSLLTENFFDLENKQKTLDLTDLKPGLYIVKLQSKEGFKMIRIIKE